MSFIKYEPSPDKNIFLIDMRTEPMKPFSEMVQKGIYKYLQQGKRIGILVNKKGYASGTICSECGYIPRCDHCDIAIANHQNDQGKYFGICHICKKQYPYDPHCKNCGGLDTKMYGIGAQQIKEFLDEKYTVDSLVIDSSKVNSSNKMKNIYKEISHHQIIIGTSLLTTPISQYPFDIIIIMHADLGLNIPDFQANWHNFLFLYELFYKHTNQTFLVQTYKPEHNSIHLACKMDIGTMRKKELKYRKENNYPPFIQMCVLLYKHEKEKNLYTITNKLYQELLFLKEKYELQDIEIYATPPLVYKKFGKFRYNIILKGQQLRHFMDIAFVKLKIKSRGFQVDWEPQGII